MNSSGTLADPPSASGRQILPAGQPLGIWDNWMRMTGKHNACVPSLKVNKRKTLPGSLALHVRDVDRCCNLHRSRNLTGSPLRRHSSSAPPSMIHRPVLCACQLCMSKVHTIPAWPLSIWVSHIFVLSFVPYCSIAAQHRMVEAPITTTAQTTAPWTVRESHASLNHIPP